VKRPVPSLSGILVRGFRVVRNLTIDLRAGNVLGAIYLKKRTSSNSDYYALSQIFEGRIRESDVLVDVGCGQGRVINWWLMHHPRNKMIGIELDKNIARQTRARFAGDQNVAVVSGDAIKNIPENGTIFYLYNPFEVDTVRAFKDRLASLFEPSQGILLLYYNCKHLSVFEHDPAWRIARVDLGGPKSAPFDELAVITMV